MRKTTVRAAVFSAAGILLLVAVAIVGSLWIQQHTDDCKEHGRAFQSAEPGVTGGYCVRP